jgi:hypothetical protein
MVTELSPTEKSSKRAPIDSLTAASVTIAWVIIANKPFYPAYVWYLTGDGVAMALWTMISVPFFLLVPYFARSAPLAARLALPIVGTLDTLFETKLFGEGSGTLLFLAPCIMLVALSFRIGEAWHQRMLAALFFVVFAASFGRLEPAMHVWDAADLASLFALNAFAVASLTAFIAIKYAGVARA